MSNKDPNPVKYTGVQNFKPTGNYPTDFARPGALDANSPVAGGAAHLGGDYVPASYKTASTTNSDTTLNTTASEKNLSAQYKYPQVSQDTVPQDLVAKPGSSI